MIERNEVRTVIYAFLEHRIGHERSDMLCDLADLLLDKKIDIKEARRRIKQQGLLDLENL